MAKTTDKEYAKQPGKLDRPFVDRGRSNGPIKDKSTSSRLMNDKKNVDWRYRNNGHRYMSSRFPSVNVDKNRMKRESVEHIRHDCTLPLREHAYIRVMCKGRHTDALLDTGASRSIISRQFLDCLPGKHILQPSNIKNFIVANSNEMRVMGVITLPVLLGENRCHMSFHVVEDLATEVIIGRDYMIKYRIRINYKNEMVSFDLEEGLFNVDSVVISPNSQIKIEMRLRDRKKHCNFVAKVMPNTKHPLSPIIARKEQVAKINDGRTYIMVCNKGNRPIELTAGTRLAIASAVNPYQKINQGVEGRQTKTFPRQDKPRRTDSEYRKVIEEIEFEGSVLTERQQYRLKQIIWPVRQVLSVDGDIGCLKDYEYTIELKDDSPISAVPYRLSPVAKQVMKKHLEDLERQGVICRYMSDYSSPCMLVRKPGYEGVPITEAKHRLVLDLRKLNAQAKRVNYQIPHIVETISQMEAKNMQYVSVIDLTKGFNQIPLNKESLRYTSFKTDGLGSYAQCRLPQGFVNSGEIFQSLMEGLLDDELRKYCHVYMDDLAILTSSFDKHMENLQKLLDTLKRNGLTVQIGKSKFCQKEVKFLGYIIGRDGVKIRPEKAKVIKDMPRPRNVKQVRSFLGAMGWNRRFIRDFSIKARPLHDLTKKDAPFLWNDKCENSFKELKEALMTAPVLKPIDYDKKLILVTDASDKGLGATLMQEDDNQNLHVIAYYSRALNPHEVAYSITEKEALAVLSAVRHFATYLRFSEFEIRTDHRALQYIFKTQKRPQENARLTRWGMYLSAFNFEISFVAGDSSIMKQSDWYSRCSPQ